VILSDITLTFLTRGVRCGIRFPPPAENFYVIQGAQRSPCEHKAIYSVCTEAKQTGCAADHLTLFNAKMKNAWNNTSIPHMPSGRVKEYLYLLFNCKEFYFFLNLSDSVFLSKNYLFI
jgi:hypothetical protein